MTKASSILVMPVVKLSSLREPERSIVREFLFTMIRGVDTKHDKRWRRLWSRMWKAEEGEVTHLQSLIDRSGPFHRLHMGLEDRLFKAQDRFINQEALRNWLKTGAAFGHYELVKGVMKFVPSSLAYEQCSDDEMREVHEAMVDYLHTPRAQRILWRHLSMAKRQEMLDAVLAKQEDAA